MRQPRLLSSAALILAALVTLMIGTTGRAAAKRPAANRLRPLPLPSDLPVPLPDDPADLLTPPSTPRPSPTPTATPEIEARFSWSLVPRVRQYRRGRAFDAATRSYDPGYVYPTSWLVNFDACASAGGGRPIRDYIWKIDGIDVEDFHHTVTTDTCHFNHATPPTPQIPRPCVLDPDAVQCEDLELELEEQPEASPTPPVFPREGRYRVRLTVRNRDWSTASVTQEVAIKDWLIVSVGDSNASGEGNPDVPADWDLLHIDFSEIEVSDPFWEDAPCNRSQTSGPALAAELIEYGDPHTTVTFLSFACSGATLTDIMAQIDAARVLLCGDAHYCRHDARRVDALLISGGVNDLGFSGIIKTCAAFDKHNIDGSLLDQLLIPYERAVTACDDHLAGTVNSALFGLYQTYAQLNEHIVALRPEETYITEYPTEVFYDDDGEPDGCGLFDEVSSQEASWITESGEQLNGEVLGAAQAFGWNYVGGIASRFRGHGYCADDSWFVELSDSLIDQLGIKGAVHPTGDGHLATAEQLVEAFFSAKPDRTPVRQVTITFEQVKVVNKRTYGDIGISTEVQPRLNVNLGVLLTRQPREGSFKDLTVTSGEWVDLPADEYSTTLRVAAGDTVQVHGKATLPAVYTMHPKTFERIEQEPVEYLTINRTYSREEGFGAGSHDETRTHSDGSITIRYRIDVVPIRPGQAPSLPAEQIDSPAQIER